MAQSAPRRPARLWRVAAVVATALPAAWILHGLFRALCVGASAFALYALLRRRGPAGGGGELDPRGPAA